VIDVGGNPLIVPDPHEPLFYLADRKPRPGTDREGKPRKNGTVGVLDPDNGTITKFAELNGAATALAIDSDGSRLFAADDNTVKVITTADMKAKEEVLTFESVVSAIAVAPGGGRIYVTEQSQGDLHVLDIDPVTHKVLRAREWSFGDGNSSVVVTQDRVFVGVTEEGVKVWDNAGNDQGMIPLPKELPERSCAVKSLALRDQKLYVGLEITISNPAQGAVGIYDLGAGYKPIELLMLGKAPLASLTATPTEVLAVNQDVSSISRIS
jgi:sugar lactone lactonase YvrE